MGTSVSIIILVLYISTQHLYCFYVNILINLPLFSSSNSSQKFLVISLVKVKKSKENYTVLFWHYNNKF